ncbi:MAG: class I SAM-dependent methyltransferase [Candidatus Alcyoniella australis]|nr:class I SAM-dependent methyltransferase [Candidatus Alcyoniella australis]
MRHADKLFSLYGDLDLSIEDLYLLERFQIAYLPQRAPDRALAVVLHKYPSIKRFLTAMQPQIGDYISEILKRYDPLDEDRESEKAAHECIWELADLLIYCKHPEIYDRRSNLGTDFSLALEGIDLCNKIVLDAGAGTGRLSFWACNKALTVFAVEPCSSMRHFIRNKAKRKRIYNLYAMDGQLDSLQIPENDVDVLLTCHAIGWNLEAELREIERVVKPNGIVVHLSGYNAGETNPIHDTITSEQFGYQAETYAETDGEKTKYTKQF